MTKTPGSHQSLKIFTVSTFGLPRWLSSEEPACNAGGVGWIPVSGRSPGEGNGIISKKELFLPGKSHGQRSLVGYSPCGCRVRHDLVTKQQQSPPLLKKFADHLA